MDTDKNGMGNGECPQEIIREIPAVKNTCGLPVAPEPCKHQVAGVPQTRLSHDKWPCVPGFCSNSHFECPGNVERLTPPKGGAAEVQRRRKEWVFVRIG